MNFLDGLSKSLADRRGLRDDKDSDIWKCRWLSNWQRRVDTVRPVGLFDMPLFHHRNKVAFKRRLYAFFW